MTDAEAEKDTEDTDVIEQHPQGAIKLETCTGLELLRHIQNVFEQNLDKDEPWIEVWYTDNFEQTQYMRLWMRPDGHHVSRSKH